MRKASTLLALCGLAALGARAAADPGGGTPLETGRTYAIESKALGETRTIDVALPGGYAADPKRRYPVLYVLDGEFEAGIAIAITGFYAGTAQLPPMIVVGVRNTDRMRDLTPAPAAGFTPPPEAGSRGGAGRFLEFLANELVPWVDRNSICASAAKRTPAWRWPA